MTVIQYIHIAVELWGAVFCLIAAVCVYVTRRFDPKATNYLCMLLLVDAVLNLSESFAYYYRGDVSRLGYIMVRVTNFVVFVCGYLLSLFTCKYLDRIIVRQGGTERVRWNHLIYAFCGLGIFLLVLSRFCGFYYAFDEQNRYYRLNTYWVMNVIGLVPLILLYIRIIRSRGLFRPLQYLAFLAFILFPLVGDFIQIVHYGISVYNIMNTICLMFFFVTYEMGYADYMVERERKLSREQIRLYHSQIQPHFVFNSLTVILSYLQPDSEAAKALEHFTKFLRGSIDMLTETECVSAEREFATVEHYLYMEKERFGDKIQFVSDVQDRDFFLPTFTVQTLVENAINHGIRGGRADGRGTLTIRSFQRADEHVIEVQDDGVGFCPDLFLSQESLQEENVRHIGLMNLKNRLELMCGGTLEIESTIGKGTLARVHIPGGKRQK